MRWGLLVGCVMATWCMLASEAHAEWRRVQDVTRGTAQVLEKGELTFGVFAPIAYGVTDDLTVQSSPIFDLLLIPNFAARYSVFDSRSTVVSLLLSYKQGFYRQQSQPGEIDIGVTATSALTDRVSITGGLYVSDRFGQTDPGGDAAGLSFHGGLHWLVSPGDLIAASVQQRWSKVGLERPEISLTWVTQMTLLFRAHLVLGASYGTFPLRTSPASTWSIWRNLDICLRY